MLGGRRAGALRGQRGAGGAGRLRGGRASWMPTGGHRRRRAPDTMLARQAGLELGERGGVVCSSRLETSVPGVFAAGDICEYDSAVHGGPMRIEHWDVAFNHGKTAALNMLGRERRPRGRALLLLRPVRLGFDGVRGAGVRVGRGGRARLDRRRRVLGLVPPGPGRGRLSVGRSEDLERARRLMGGEGRDLSGVDRGLQRSGRIDRPVLGLRASPSPARRSRASCCDPRSFRLAVAVGGHRSWRFSSRLSCRSPFTWCSASDKGCPATRRSHTVRTPVLQCRLDEPLLDMSARFPATRVRPWAFVTAAPGLPRVYLAWPRSDEKPNRLALADAVSAVVVALD